MNVLISEITGHMQARGWYLWARRSDGRYDVSPCGDHAMLWSDVVCVVDDFGTLVRVPA